MVAVTQECIGGKYSNLVMLWALVELKIYAMHKERKLVEAFSKARELMQQQSDGEAKLCETVLNTSGLIMLMGAPLAKALPKSAIRGVVATIGFGMSAIFFWRLF